MKKTQKGFTLVELLVVIAILAILSTVAVVGYTSFINKAEKQAAETEVAQIKTVIENAFILDDEVVVVLPGATDAADDDTTLILKNDGTARELTTEDVTKLENITDNLGADVLAKLSWASNKLVYKYESTSDKAPFLVELTK